MQSKLLRSLSFLITLLICFSSFHDITNHSYKMKSKISKSDKKHIDLAICAIFQNEAPWIKEWIEFHKLVGVQHFYLYNNLSTDDYQSVLAPYVASGEVELVEWPYRNQPSDVAEWTRIQCGAYQDALQKAKNSKVCWLAILDLDEYLFAVQEDNIVDFLNKHVDQAGLLVNWQMYGTSFVKKIPSNQLMIETLTLKAPTDYAENAFIKSIVRPHKVLEINDPHKVVYSPRAQGMNSDRFVFRNSIAPYIVVDKIRINHYWSRDEEYFKTRKMPRRQSWLEGASGQINRLANLNAVEDKAIFRFVPALRKKMGLD